ncbi:formate dehydrogenase subunit gamma [Salipiger abyssi]|uniref:formate dehydrogenase subunit gamma n=1 Tax=Salipiger abyssi TaxID=1250539 RepID=UPI004058183F
MRHSNPTPDEIRALIDAELHREGPLLPILHAIQHAFDHVPEMALPLIAEALNLTRAEVHGVMSFYHDFRKAPAGRHVVKICRAEACQSMGANALSQAVLDKLGLDWGGTTPDGSVTVEPVYCLGLCACAPAAMVDGKLIGRADAARLSAELEGTA